jgi:hypothetical protein
MPEEADEVEGVVISRRTRRGRGQVGVAAEGRREMGMETSQVTDCLDAVRKEQRGKVEEREGGEGREEGCPSPSCSACSRSLSDDVEALRTA